MGRVSPISCCRRETLAYPCPQAGSRPRSSDDSRLHSDTLTYSVCSCNPQPQQQEYVYELELDRSRRVAFLNESLRRLQYYAFKAEAAHARWTSSLFGSAGELVNW
ncbi:hypothetical protein JOB18_036337 [Solea senegalensis]|nr:hypothetical protein JOB18_036337 [Solea senegalensis]